MSIGEMPRTATFHLAEPLTPLILGISYQKTLKTNI